MELKKKKNNALTCLVSIDEFVCFGFSAIATKVSPHGSDNRQYNFRN